MKIPSPQIIRRHILQQLEREHLTTREVGDSMKLLGIVNEYELAYRYMRRMTDEGLIERLGVADSGHTFTLTDEGRRRLAAPEKSATEVAG